MYFLLHQITHGFIDHAMALHKIFVGKGRADDAHSEVATALGAGVTGVLVALVDNVDGLRGKGALEPFTDPCGAVDTTHGSTLRNGLTLTRA